MKNNKKLKVVYPDGRIECNENVAETFRNAIAFMDPEKVRQLDERINSINIVSTPIEAKNSTGKQESQNITIEGKTGREYIVCTQMSTAAKYRKLQKINDELGAGLIVSLVEPVLPNDGVMMSIEDEEVSTTVAEGLAREYNLTRYERNSRAREICLKHYGYPYVCQICGFDFEKTYGKREAAEPYIEVHHINPHAILSAKGVHKVDCTRDLIPVCANCHSMLHHLRSYILSPDELRKIVSSMSRS